ncbi:hypothetical protein SEUCBS139899_003302 [Sporothrix eucalyptigena]
MAAQHRPIAPEGDEIMQRAPGTELLFDTAMHHGEATGLQFIQQNGQTIFLVPQPSLTDPNDPLNWSHRKKWAVYLNGVAYAFMGSVTGPIMSAGMQLLAAQFHDPLQKISYANGATLICQGVGNILWMPFVLKIGRRPVYMVSNILMGIVCVWLGLASKVSYTPLIIGRAFLGFFEAPIESIVPTTITDIFFLHDRGEKVSLYGLSVLGGNELGPLTKFTGPRPTVHLGQPVVERNGENTDMARDERVERANDVDDFRGGKTDDASGTETRTHLSSSPNVQNAPEGPAKHSFSRSLRLWQKPDPNVSLKRALLRPFILLTYPTVVWASVMYGFSVGWNVILGATLAQLFGPQYGFNSQAQGLVFLSPFVGSLVGSWLCGSLSDKVANYFTRKNEGIREPEMRLPVCVLGTVFTFLGALTLTLTYHYNTHYMGPIVGLGILFAGAQLSVELMVTVASLKSAIAWIWTWVINDWILSDGMLVVFIVIASINVVVHMSTIIFYFWGQKIRVWIAEKQMLVRCGLV